MDKKRIIEKLDWLFKSALSAPDPTSRSLRKSSIFSLRTMFIFLQDNGFTTRTILKENEKATDDSEIRVGDLTPEGLKFYFYGIRKWREKYDRAKDKKKAINDFAFIEKKIDEVP